MSTENAMPSLDEILRRLDEVAESRHDAARARALGVNRGTFSAWKQRGTIPFERLVSFAQREAVSLDFLLFGAGAPKTPTLRVERELAAIEASLSRTTTPIPAEEVEGVPQVREAQERLALVSADETVPEELRARADMLLAVGFGDEAAAKRRRERHDRHTAADRAAYAAYAEVTALVGWEPPMVIRGAVLGALQDGLSAKGATRLLELLKVHEDARWELARTEKQLMETPRD